MNRPYTLPLVCAATSASGLLIALVGDGWVDRVGAVALAIPFFVLGWRLRPERGRSSRDSD